MDKDVRKGWKKGWVSMNEGWDKDGRKGRMVSVGLRLVRKVG